MGCSACGHSLPARVGSNRTRPEISGDCSYTLDLIDIWYSKLLCVKEKNLHELLGITKYKLNVYLGIVKSAINTGKPCSYTRFLDEINLLILNLINLAECQ